MAHFAKIGIDNVVLEVLVVNNVDTMTPQGEEKEEIGVAFLQKLTGHSAWKQTSYNSNIRKHYAGVGYTYNESIDAFVAPKPYTSWVLDEEKGVYAPPTPMPTDGKNYFWSGLTTSWKVFPTKPNDGQNYKLSYLTDQWQVAPEMPNDGKQYVFKQQQWAWVAV